MDISAALNSQEAAALSDADSSFEQAEHRLRTAGAGVQEDAGLALFEESLRLKNTLDAFEERGM